MLKHCGAPFGAQRLLRHGMLWLRGLPEGDTAVNRFKVNYEWLRECIKSSGEDGAVEEFRLVLQGLITVVQQQQGQQQQLDAPHQSALLPPTDTMQLQNISLSSWELLSAADAALLAVLKQLGASFKCKLLLRQGLKHLQGLPEGHAAGARFILNYEWLQTCVDSRHEEAAAEEFRLGLEQLIREAQPVA